MNPLVVCPKSSDLPTPWNLKQSGNYCYTSKVTAKLFGSKWKL